jgi:hypothetical protein
MSAPIASDAVTILKSDGYRRASDAEDFRPTRIASVAVCPLALSAAVGVADCCSWTWLVAGSPLALAALTPAPALGF